LLSNILLHELDRGWNVRRTIRALAAKLRGWINYFRYAMAKGIFNELDGWLRRHLRKILWRQWKRGRTRARMLIDELFQVLALVALFLTFFFQGFFRFLFSPAYKIDFFTSSSCIDSSYTNLKMVTAG
jgi:hypothetical protein